jgi:hypothetical protein
MTNQAPRNFTDHTLSFDRIVRIVAYCAEEVRRQHDTHLHVAYMVNAWLDALEHQEHKDALSLGMVERWGILVDPNDNPTGFRGADVYIAGRMGTRVPELADALERWINFVPDMTPLEAYKEFEWIHPFIDGNGRTGKIILNYLNETLLDPIFPPDNLFGYPITNP